MVGVSYGSSSWSTARVFPPSTCSTWAAALSSQLPAHQLPMPLPSLPHRRRRCSRPPLATFLAQRTSAVIGLPSSLSNYLTFALGSSVRRRPSSSSSPTSSTLFPPVVGYVLIQPLLVSLGCLSCHHTDRCSLLTAYHNITPYPYRLQCHRCCSRSLQMHFHGTAFLHSRCLSPGLVDSSNVGIALLY